MPSSSTHPAPPAPGHPIALLYRLVFNWVEPVLAIAGVLQLLLAPRWYLSMASPVSGARYAAGGGALVLDALSLQIGGGWLLLAYNDMVLLRSGAFARDVRAWRYVIAAHAVSDTMYTLALARDMGLQACVRPQEWSTGVAATVALTLVPFALKLTLLAGIGVDESKCSSRMQREKAN